MIQQFNSIMELVGRFPDEQSCIDHLTEIRWRNGKFCPHCGGTEKVYTFKNNRTHKCGDCRLKFSIKVGTIFEDSKVPLRKWFMAIYLITAHKKGISSVQLGKDIGVTQKTAWFMNHRLREATKTKAFNEPFKNTVEVDETYVGGKAKNMHKVRRQRLEGRGPVGKQIAVAIVERQGSVRTFHVPDSRQQTLQNLVKANVALGSKVNTDEHSGYQGLDTFYLHGSVNHVGGSYVVGDTHTNTVEGFFAGFKRGVYGIYHHVSKKHLRRYLNEFSLRYNHRNEDNGAGFLSLLVNSNGRLTYRGLIAGD